MFKERVKGFIAGVCVTAALMGTVTVFATSIDVVMGGIKVYWDGIEKTLTDVNGNKVEPMIYNGTTYVPIRAMANLLGKEVSWNQQDQAVIVGEMPTAKSTSIVDMDSKINYGDTTILTGKNASFNLKDKTIQCENMVRIEEYSDRSVKYPYSASTMYMLNGDYTRLIGKAVMPYDMVGDDSKGGIKLYSVENDGTETEIAAYDLQQTEEPIDIDVNLKGVENLKIYYWFWDSRNKPAFYNVYFLSE